MPGDTVVQGAQPVEYVEETSFATAETDGAYNWIGLVTAHSVTQSVEAANVRYLPADSSTDKLETVKNVKVSEVWENELTYHPQTVAGLLNYFTGAAGDTGDSLTSIQIGEQNENSDEYRRLLGAVGEEWSMTISEDSPVEVSASFLAADGEDWGATDYVGKGSHAAENSADPVTYDDLANVQLGGAAVADHVEELVLTVSNDLTVVKDPDAARNSQIAAIVPTSREITAELSLTYDDMTMAQTVRSYTAQNLTFDVGAVSFTVNDVKFPEFPYEMGPEDLVGDSVSSDPATGLTWA